MAFQRKTRRGAIAAATDAATALGLKVDDVIVLHDSNKFTLRLLPCDAVARVAEERARRWAEFEIGLAQRLADTDSPLAALKPRVEPVPYVRGGFVITMCGPARLTWHHFGGPLA
jgi:hypothetical protein